MCVIVDKYAGFMLSISKVRAAATRNSDGIGVMYVDPNGGGLKAEKWLPKTVGASMDVAQEQFERLKNVHAVFHMRIRTHGQVSLDNCHPFRVTNKKDHGRDIMFMHNGVINIKSDDPADRNKSDTVLFNETILQPMLQEYPDALYNTAFQALIEEYIGSSKLLFMDDLGRIVRLGYWMRQEGLPVSNNNYFQTYQSSYSNGGYYANKGATGGQPIQNKLPEVDDDAAWDKWQQDYERSNYYSGTREKVEAGGTCGIAETKGEVFLLEKKKEEELPFGRDATPQGVAKASTKEKTPEEIAKEKEEVILEAQARIKELAAKTEVTQDKGTFPEDDEESDEGKAVVMVWSTQKHIDDLTVDDLVSIAHMGDLYDFIEDYPERAAVLVAELIDAVEEQPFGP